MTTASRIVREEAWRSVAWFVVSMLGWSVIITSTDRIEATTGVVLAVATTLALVGATVAVRLVTGRDLTSASGPPPLLNAIAGTAIVGFGCVYAVVVLGYTPLLFAGYLGLCVLAFGTLALTT